MVFDKDRATSMGAEAAADVIKELEKEAADDINIDEDFVNDIHNTTFVDEAQSMSSHKHRLFLQLKLNLKGRQKEKGRLQRTRRLMKPWKDHLLYLLVLLKRQVNV